MIPVPHSPDIKTTKDIRHFRAINHSTHSRRLFGDMDVDVDVKLPPWSGKLSDLDWLAGTDWAGNGRLETALIGQKLDGAAISALSQLSKGGLFQNLLSNLFRGLYMRLRSNIIRFLLKILYQVLLIVLSLVYGVIWRLLTLPLMLISSLLLVIVVIAYIL